MSPDGAFTFTYPRSLIKCEKDPKQEDRWIPDRSCEAVIPVCSYASLTKDATLACIAYPAETLCGTNFEAAAFSATFDVLDVGGVAVGSFLADDAYRNFHQNRCYELDLRVQHGGS